MRYRLIVEGAEKRKRNLGEGRTMSGIGQCSIVLYLIFGCP